MFILPARASDNLATLNKVPAISSNQLTKALEKRHGHVVALHVWAACCENCRGTYLGLGSLQRNYPRDGVEVISILVDLPTKRADANKWIKRNPPPVLLWRKDTSDPDIFAEAINSDWHGKLPFTQIYSTDGTAAALIEGPHSIKAIKQKIDQCLQESARQSQLNNQ